MSYKMTIPTNANIKVRIEALLKAFEAKSNARLKDMVPSLVPHVFEVEYGTKYAKLIRDRSVAGFVELATGNIYYPASWKAPSKKHVRGNVFEDDYGVSCFGDYAVKTLR